MLDRAFLKQEARGYVRGAHVSAYLFTLLYLVITTVLNGLSNYVVLDSQRVWFLVQFYGLPLDPSDFHAPFPGLLVTFVTVMVMLLGAILSGGWVLYHLGVRRGEHQDFATLFDGFSFAGKLIVLNLLQALFIFCWSLLLVIPGIIAAYRYRFAIYNLCENPHISALEALRLSKEQTAGFKGQLFLLDLSFLGWSLLRAMTFNILSIWIMPYVLQTNLGYYQQIKAFKEAQRPSAGPGGVDPNDPFRPL